MAPRRGREVSCLPDSACRGAVGSGLCYTTAPSAACREVSPKYYEKVHFTMGSLECNPRACGQGSKDKDILLIPSLTTLIL